MMTATKIENDIFYDETNNIVKNSEPDQISSTTQMLYIAFLIITIKASFFMEAQGVCFHKHYFRRVHSLIQFRDKKWVFPVTHL